MHLIIQGQNVETTDLKQLAKMVSAESIQQIAPNVFRLTPATQQYEVAILCARAELDFAYVPPSQTWDNIGLVAMDMDSTLITIECIDEIADMLDLKAPVAAITEAAMRGEIDFAESLKQRVALLKGLDESALQRVYDERLKLTAGAEMLLGQIQARGIKTLLVSGGFTFFTQRLQQRLRLDYSAANTLEIVEGKLTGDILGRIVDAQAKAAHLHKIRCELDLKPEQTLAIGDGANDLKMLGAAGIGVAFHAKPVVCAESTYAINYGGLDAVWHLLNS